MPKLPWPPDAVDAGDAAWHETSDVLWRVHRLEGEHPAPWDRLRRWGPAASCRFDPHPDGPPATHAEGVAYTASDVPTALSEMFQGTRVINLARGRPQLSGWQPVRPLRLLDLTGSWPLRIGASHVINSGRRDHCRAWARLLRRTWPAADGLLHTSSLTGRACVTLYDPATDSFPAQPGLSAPLLDPALTEALTEAAAQIGYRIV